MENTTTTEQRTPMSEHADLPEVAPHDEPERLIKLRQRLAARLDSELVRYGLGQIDREDMPEAVAIAQLVDHFDRRLLVEEESLTRKLLDQNMAQRDTLRSELTILGGLVDELLEVVDTHLPNSEHFTGKLDVLLGPINRLAANRGQ